MDDGERVIDAHAKALQINLDARRYGTFAEIGAGQEVVRWFFRVGGAAGTIAKSMSAYDMAVSDAIYGKAERYVCRPRLEAMLDHEHELNLERPQRAARGDDGVLRLRRHGLGAQLPRHQRVSRLDGRALPVAPARSTTARSSSTCACSTARTPCSRRRSASSASTSSTARSSSTSEPELLIESLLDGLTTQRIEIDMIEFSGIEFRAGRQPPDEHEAGAARPVGRGDVRSRRRGAAAVGGAAQEERAGRARQLPAGLPRQHGHAALRARELRARSQGRAAERPPPTPTSSS